jgi:UPF0755 protein
VTRKILLFAGVVIFLAMVAGWVGWQRYSHFLLTPLDVPEEGAVFTVEPGSTGVGIVRQLSVQGFTRMGWEWRLLMRLEPHLYRAGEYQLRAGMTPGNVLGIVSRGEVIQYRITLVEGWTFKQFAQALTADKTLRHELDLDTATQWGLISEALDIEHPEGWFFPETYQFTRGDSDRDILVRAHQAMQAHLQEAWALRDDDAPLRNPYEMLILASIIEKETARDDERGQIAGVFSRRLKKGMRLQTDPTVIYGMGDAYDGDIRRKDLQTDTPYNTYTNHGLPPTPIAMPGKASLLAAAQPEEGETLYFVADGNGGHTFSTTLKEHQAAVRKLLEKG